MFIAWQTLLDYLLDDLRRGGGQHHLLAGESGSDMSAVLLRLATALEDDENLSTTCTPLHLVAGQYDVARPSDFWTNALIALVGTFQRRGDQREVNRIETAVAKLAEYDEDERSRRAIAVLQAWGKRRGRLLVLLVDQFNLVLDRLADFHWAIREALSQDNGIVVVGASTTLSKHVIDYHAPFYDFFNVHQLSG